MDVTFRESEPFYGEKTDLSDVFEGLDQSPADDVSQEGERTLLENSCGSHIDVQVADSHIGVQVGAPSASTQIDAEVGARPKNGSVPRWTAAQEEQLKVYTRKRGVGVAHQGEQLEQPHIEQQGSTDVISVSLDGDQVEPESVAIEGSIDLPIALRKGTRAATTRPVDRYGFNVNDIGNYVSYESLYPSYKAFVASLQSVVILTDWKKAKDDSKWRMAMVEELEALCKNKTWVLTHLPTGKKAVSCKWVYTVKQNAEGKIERYKARLVARGYS
jgi:hypothetical protein